MKTWLASGFAGFLALPVFAAPVLPPGFTSDTLVKNINAAAALAVAPDGRVFYAEQTGVIRVVRDGKLLPGAAIDLSAKVDAWWERGLIGITLHPDFPRAPFLFAVYVAKGPCTHHVVSRFTVVGDALDPESELVLLEGDDQANFSVEKAGGHQGGPICFGSDGMLYIGLGELTAGKPAQSLDTLHGKILRLRPDGSIPPDNPFFEQATGKNRAIYAIGIRNPFGLAIEPGSGRLLETEVGRSAFEEINEIVAGGNYGWPEAEGASGNPAFRDPLHAYPAAIGRSICGAMFYPDTGNFPAQWHGKFFFVDWAAGWIKAIDPGAPDKLIPFGEGFAAPVGIAAAPDGSVFVLNRNTRWIDGDKFKENAGSLVQIRYAVEAVAPAKEPPHPPKLAATGVFGDLETLQPAAGFHSFELNAPVWLPGVTARRWIRVPAGNTIAAPPDGHWRLPEGSVIVQHFDSVKGAHHETHVYVARSDGTFRAAAYRWHPGETDATLVEQSEIVPLAGEDSLQWFSPGPESALDPDLALAGFVLQLNAAQLNRGDQLQAWRERGWLDASLTDALFAQLPKLAALDDADASVEDRVRSYLDSNCAACHRPGGFSRGLFDARFSTPLEDQRLLLGDLMAGDFAIAGAKAVVPGAPEKSALYLRMKRQDAFRMPPVAVNHVPSPALSLIEQWIRGLGPAGAE